MSEANTRNILTQAQRLQLGMHYAASKDQLEKMSLTEATEMIEEDPAIGFTVTRPNVKTLYQSLEIKPLPTRRSADKVIERRLDELEKRLEYVESYLRSQEGR